MVNNTSNKFHIDLIGHNLNKAIIFVGTGINMSSMYWNKILNAK